MMDGEVARWRSAASAVMQENLESSELRHLRCTESRAAAPPRREEPAVTQVSGQKPAESAEFNAND